ncbi:hypothetical protein ADL21_07725 [Streptomyces albus subsp. albus]|nr:hypothetical protein ADL21_07725 [Streptomyces albus subsp. albus]
MRQQLLSFAAAVPTALTGAPWWAVMTCAVLIPVAGQLRGLLRDRAARRLDARLMETVSELADPQERTRALIDYRRAGQADPPGPAEDNQRPQEPGTT